MSEKKCSIIKKKPSGAQNRKRKRLQEQEDQDQARKMSKFLIRNSDCPIPVENEREINVDSIEMSNENITNTVISGINETENTVVENLDFCDPGEWPSLNEKVVQMIVEKGPFQIKEINFPKKNNRKFNTTHYFRLLPNGEKIPRPWLVYSVKNDAIYCFCCKLFWGNKNPHSLSSTGFSDWWHTSQILKGHENNSIHMESFRIWKFLEEGLAKSTTIDSSLQKAMKDEIYHWNQVLRRLLAFVQFLGAQSLSFRGASCDLNESDSGNFLKLVKMVAKFDLVLAEHLRRINDKETQYSYLSKNIQNELIALISNSAVRKIVEMIKTAKYFSIIVDSTPDKSHVEQVTLIIRFLGRENGNFQIREHFLGFLDCNNKTGAGLTDLVLEKLDGLGLLISNCRGQGYDNGSNMKGKNVGMQKKIRELEPRAFFVPCSAHSLNLVVNDSAHCSIEAVNFFGVVQSIYVFFSGSVNRWEIYKKHVEGLTVKPLCDTRWESRIDALRPLKNSLPDIYDALLEISTETNDNFIKVTADSLGNKLLQFNFICSLLVWYDILEKISVASKYLQNKKIDVSVALQILKNTKICLCEMRDDNIFEKYIEKAKTIAEELEIPPNFSSSRVRSRKKKKLAGENLSDEAITDPQQAFKINFYFQVLDKAISSIEERFEQIQQYGELFSFLLDIHSTESVPNLKQLCQNLAKSLTHNESKDLNGDELFQELLTLSPLLNSEYHVWMYVT